MKAMVTGAPGWLGTRLIEVLRENGRDVCAIVLKGMDASYLEMLGAEVIEADITDGATLSGALNGVGTVFHCAGIIHPSLFRAKDFYRINSDGTRNMLEASVNAGVKKFIHVSSNSAQGVNVRRSVLMTEDGPDKPYTDYGISKHKAEQIVKEYQRAGRIETVIIRPCWFYGPRQPARMTKLMNMIKDGSPLLFGDGKNIRSMTYIDNLIDAMLLVEDSDKAIGETYWIANEEPRTSLEIYEEIARNLGVELKPKYVPKIVSQILEKVDILLGKFGIYEINVHVGGEMVRDIGCSIEKAKKELGYEPKVSFEEGIKASVEWAKEEGLV